MWFFVTDWFPIYLIAKGIPLKSGLIAVWIPFLAADLGNFFGGGASGYLIRHGWSLGAARKALHRLGLDQSRRMLFAAWRAGHADFRGRVRRHDHVIADRNVSGIRRAILENTCPLADFSPGLK